MNANPNTRAIDHNETGGLVWNRLHSEREDICEALLKEPAPGCDAAPSASTEEARRTANWHKELLQTRLRKLDDALDRLMSGSYGNCCRCGRWIEDTKLDFDPAIAFCIECWQREQSQARTEPLIVGNREVRLQAIPTSDSLEDNPSLAGVALETLAPFDTIWVQTLNSDYRIFLLDPTSGRALVEGGRHFVEPVEAMVNGSTVDGFTLKSGWIGVGLRIGMWVNDKIVSTSPVQSFRVERQSPEPASLFNSVLH